MIAEQESEARPAVIGGGLGHQPALGVVDALDHRVGQRFLRQALPGRRTIVVTRNQDWSSEGVDSASSPKKAMEIAGQGRCFVVGGAEIYRQMLPHCHELWLTRVWSTVEGDTKLSIDLSQFRVIEQTRVPASARDDVPTEFLRMIR